MKVKRIVKARKKYTKKYEQLYDKMHGRNGDRLTKQEYDELDYLIDKISSQALKDIGFEDTEEARKIIWQMMQWD